MVKSSSRILHTPDRSTGLAKNRQLGNNGRRQYKGVRMRSWGSWVSEIRAPNQKTRIWLGSYSTPEAAARAYDAALLCLKGNPARLNFPTSPLLHLPETTTMSPKSIQRVAAAAAAVSASTTSPPNSSSTSPSVSSYTSDDESSTTNPLDEGVLTEGILIDPSINFEAFFQSPKCMDYMFNASAFFAPSQAERDEEVDITLWSFC